MFSKTNMTVFVVAALVAIASAAPHVVWDPPITSPKAGDIWVAGSTYNVTWFVLIPFLSFSDD